MNKQQKIITTLFGIAIMLAAVFAIRLPGRWQPIAAYRTGLNGRTNAQAHNLRLSSNAINGKIIPAHGVFSFNHTVGSWTAERGYVKAPVSYDGELIPAWGGGVCQTSSTLYNAALLAGMEIIERHRHRFPAKYVPPGQDAAVAQYDIDLRFRNPYDWPVMIESDVQGDGIVCRIMSQKPISKEFSVEREIRQVTTPTEVVRARSGGDDIRWRVRNRGQAGLRVAVYRRTTDGVKSTRTLISEDTYPPMNKLVEGR